MGLDEKDLRWMQHALELAEDAKEIDEVPVGAVVVVADKIVGSGYNMPIKRRSPVAHAEIIALENAAQTLNNYRILDAYLYVTLEPCLMCYGAMIHARIHKCIFGAYDPKSGVLSCGIVDAAGQYINHKVAMTGGVLAQESSLLLKNFFKQKRSNR
jgi:tRNA(adenine34) deaminase